jgi:endonuclease I
MDAVVTYRKGYYSSTANLWGQALFSALQTRVQQGHNLQNYNGARDAMFMVIDNKRVNGQGTTANTLECVYSGTEATNFNSRTEAQNNDNFNTEHTFPQAFLPNGTSTGAGTDIHHLFVTLADPNSRRANFPFDTVTGGVTYTLGGSKLGSNAGRIVFEPRLKQKGPTARAMCYMVVRWQDYGNFFAPQESILRNWALRYGPDTIDLKRNADVQTTQGNRNPFIDYPQLLERIPSLINPALNYRLDTIVEVFPSRATLSSTDTNGYYFTLYNAGNIFIPISLPPAPAGFELVVENPTTILEVGRAVTFRLIPRTATAGIYAYAPVGRSSIQITLSGQVATRPSVQLPTLSLVPNPASRYVDVQCTGSYTVYNAIGRIVRNSPPGRLDLSGTTPGVYSVRALGQSKRLVIQ